MPKKKDRSLLESTPAALAAEGAMKAVDKMQSALGGDKPEDAPMPASEHKEKAKKLGEKSGDAIDRATDGDDDRVRREKKKNKPFAE